MPKRKEPGVQEFVIDADELERLILEYMQKDKASTNTNDEQDNN